MAHYKIEYFEVSSITYLPEDHPCEIMWFERRGLSKKDISNMLLACTWTDKDILGYVYRNDKYIGMVEVQQTAVYKGTAVYLNGKRWHKHQWKRRAA